MRAGRDGRVGEEKMAIDLRAFVDSAERIVANHALDGTGAFRRWNVPSPDGSRDLGCNPYGCADAANILYTIGRFPRDRAERAGWVATLRSLQSPETGLFEEATHHTIHTTAHCIAALELFDARPEYPLTGLAALREPANMRDFLAGLDWKGDPWRASHQGAGLFAALAITEEIDLAWQDAYFAWLDAWADPATGLFGGRKIQPVAHSGVVTLVPHMAGTFHYLFNMQWSRRPLRHPERLIDCCLGMLAERKFPLGARVSFAEIDWIYCVNRARRECDHRFAEARAAIEGLGRKLCDFLLSLDPETDDGLNDLHQLFGTFCALAELQQAVPGLLRTNRPLKLVLDRRPFI
jgi:hypothetical protein